MQAELKNLKHKILHLEAGGKRYSALRREYNDKLESYRQRHRTLQGGGGTLEEDVKRHSIQLSQIIHLATPKLDFMEKGSDPKLDSAVPKKFVS